MVGWWEGHDPQVGKVIVGKLQLFIRPAALQVAPLITGGLSCCLRDLCGSVVAALRRSFRGTNGSVGV